MSQASIRRVEALLAALDRHQTNGTGPESRWAVTRLIARVEDCVETLEYLLEVLHRRVVPRGFLPVQRVPRREVEILRFFNWIRQYGEICNEVVERHINAPLQPGETLVEGDNSGMTAGDEHPSSSTDPAPPALARARSRSRSRSRDNASQASSSC